MKMQHESDFMLHCPKTGTECGGFWTVFLIKYSKKKKNNKNKSIIMNARSGMEKMKFLEEQGVDKDLI